MNKAQTGGALGVASSLERKKKILTKQINAVSHILSAGAGYLATTVEEDQRMEQSQQSAPSVKGSPDKNDEAAGCLILNPSSLKAEDY